MNLPFSRLDISTFLSPILDWTVAIVRFAMRERRGVDPLIRVVETIVNLDFIELAPEVLLSSDT